MIGFRFEGDPAEIADLIGRMRAVGIEVQAGTAKNRGGFTHQYGNVRLADYQPAVRPAAVRVEATLGDEQRALPPGRRRGLGR